MFFHSFRSLVLIGALVITTTPLCAVNYFDLMPCFYSMPYLEFLDYSIEFDSDNTSHEELQKMLEDEIDAENNPQPLSLNEYLNYYKKYPKKFILILLRKCFGDSEMLLDEMHEDEF